MGKRRGTETLKRQILGILLAACLLPALTACGAKPAADDDTLRVVATNFPAYDFARAVCGTDAAVTMLLPPGTESHSYEPTPRDILEIQNCTLFLYTGGESDTWAETILDSMDPPVEQLKMTDCVTMLEEEITEGMQADRQEEAGGVVEYDEHVWTSPRNAEEIVRCVGEKMAALDPDHADGYAARAQAYADQIGELDDAFRAFFDTVSNKTMIFGDRFPLRYFASEYGLTCYAAFPGCSTQTEPSAATIAFLTDQVRKKNVSTVYYIEFSNHLVADSIAEAAGVQTAEFDSCHNVSQKDLAAGATYVSLMERNLETLKQTMR